MDLIFFYTLQYIYIKIGEGQCSDGSLVLYCNKNEQKKTYVHCVRPTRVYSLDNRQQQQQQQQ